ncbi:MAG TPA: serine hydrolase [Thermoleophilaceae bacterium]|nr:serine hydrolase [Thermoleophilaceae bacterium]
MRRSLGTLAAVAAVALAGPASAAAQDSAEPPDVSAAAAIVVDGRDGDVMYAENPDSRRAIASTTKLMTALLTLERARPGDIFTAPPYNALPVESRINLRAGERMRVDDLLEGLLLESANDAAVTLAEGISGSRKAFVAEMNERANELGLADTSYANPIGFDDPANYSTARDLAALSLRLLRRPRFRRIVDMPVAELESGTRPRVIDNRNVLVARYPWVTGIKTGHTIQAGDVLIGSARRRDGAEVISVVLGEPSEAARDADTLALLRWGLDRFRRVRALDRRRPLARADVEYRDERVTLVARRRVRVLLRDGEQIARRVRAPDELEGPLPAGARVGSVMVLVDGRPVRRMALVTATEVPGAGTLRILTSVLGVPLTLLGGIAILVAALLAIIRIRARRRLVR